MNYKAKELLVDQLFSNSNEFNTFKPDTIEAD